VISLVVSLLTCFKLCIGHGYLTCWTHARYKVWGGVFSHYIYICHCMEWLSWNLPKLFCPLFGLLLYWSGESAKTLYARRKCMIFCLLTTVTEAVMHTIILECADIHSQQLNIISYSSCVLDTILILWIYLCSWNSRLMVHYNKYHDKYHIARNFGLAIGLNWRERKYWWILIWRFFPRQPNWQIKTPPNFPAIQ